MTKAYRLLILLASVAIVAGVILAQDITAWINGPGGKPALAVTDLRGTGAAQPLMSTFNGTLFTDLQNSGLFNMVAKSLFPLNNPQVPTDLRPDDNKQGYALGDWAGAPTGASHLVFGYTAAQNGLLVLNGYVYDTRQDNVQAAQLLGQRYVGTLDEAGAIKVAHEFANDIIQKFGGSGSLLGSRIYFARRTAPNVDEIWAMDWDGSNQKQLTNLHSTSIMPGVSPDGTRVAFTTYAKGDAAHHDRQHREWTPAALLQPGSVAQYDAQFHARRQADLLRIVGGGIAADLRGIARWPGLPARLPPGRRSKWSRR